MSDGEDVSESFADPAACGLAAALLLLFSVLVAVATGGGGTSPAVTAVDLTFHLKAKPTKPFAVQVSRGDALLCRIKDGVATAGSAFATAGPIAPLDLLRNQAALFRTPPGRSAMVFSADPLETPSEPERRTWRVSVLIQFPGRPQPVDIRCNYSGGFVVERVEVRGQVQGSAGEVPAPAVYIPDAGAKAFRLVATGREIVIER